METNPLDEPPFFGFSHSCSTLLNVKKKSRFNMPLSIGKRKRDAKITPLTSIVEEMNNVTLKFEEEEPPLEMRVVRLHTLFKRYGGQKKPRLLLFDSLKKNRELILLRHVPQIPQYLYLSEWTGTTHPDPHGTQCTTCSSIRTSPERRDRTYGHGPSSFSVQARLYDH